MNDMSSAGSSRHDTASKYNGRKGKTPAVCNEGKPYSHVDLSTCALSNEHVWLAFSSKIKVISLVKVHSYTIDCVIYHAKLAFAFCTS